MTSLLGWSRSLKEGREACGDSSSREEEEAGLPGFPRDMLDIRLSHDEPDLPSFRSVEESLSDVQGLSIPCLLTELSREFAPVLSVADGALA